MVNKLVTDTAVMLEEKKKPGVAEQSEGMVYPEQAIGMPFVTNPKMSMRNVNVFYGDKQAIHQVSVDIGQNEVVAMIGPSGCGKSTFLRSINRMNDTIDICRVEGDLTLDGEDIYSPKMDPVALRARVGMVFQKPNPFPKSIYDNVSYGPRLHGLASRRAELDEIVERSLRRAGLWTEVKDRLDQPGTGLSGGQQQRLTIARALSQEPQLLMLDEFSIAVDPVTTMRIEDVLKELKQEMTIILVTNLVQQANRLADRTAFFLEGSCVEVGDTQALFTGGATDQRTTDYIEGRFG